MFIILVNNILIFYTNNFIISYYYQSSHGCKKVITSKQIKKYFLKMYSIYTT